MIEYQIQMAARCDGCGMVLEQAFLDRPSDIESKRMDWNLKWRRQGVLLRERKYKKPLIYCQPCADGKPKEEK